MVTDLINIIDKAIIEIFPNVTLNKYNILDIPENIPGDYSCTILHSNKCILEKQKEFIDCIYKYGVNFISNIEIKNNYINFTIDNSYFIKKLIELNFYDNPIFSNMKSIHIEYCSANPTGPLHFGHGRGVVISDCLYRLYTEYNENFNDIKLEYYVNDAGNQIHKLSASLYNYIMLKFNPEFKFDEDSYTGEYYQKLAEEIITNPYSAFDFSNNLTLLDVFGNIGTKLNLKNIKKTLYKLSGVYILNQLSFINESDILKNPNTIINDFHHLTYEDNGAIFLKTTLFGDDKDRVIFSGHKKHTYFMSDILYHKQKFNNYDKVINIWGADHIGYIPRINSILDIFHIDKTRLHIILVNMVKLIRNGVLVDMSKRSGNYITLDDVIDEVGSDAVRFMFLMTNTNSQINFDIDIAKKKDKENPVYYVQYAYVRCTSILKNCTVTHPTFFKYAFDQNDIIVIKQLLLFNNIIKTYENTLTPHILAIYLYNLAKIMHAYYEKEQILGNKNKEYIISTIERVLSIGLNLLGISLPEKM